MSSSIIWNDLPFCNFDKPNAGKCLFWHEIFERRVFTEYNLSYENTVIIHGSKVSPKIKYTVQMRRRNL